MQEIKITPAMREWCKKLAQPNGLRWWRRVNNRYSTIGAFESFGSVRSPMVHVVQRMEDAGLIEWPELHSDTYYRYQAVLTEKGKEIAK